MAIIVALALISVVAWLATKWEREADAKEMWRWK